MKVFIAGPRAVRTLNDGMEEVLSRMVEKSLSVLVGDAAGVDQLVQKYFAEIKYPNVTVYASNGTARHNVGNWPVCKVEVPENVKGFKFYAQKDIQMATDAENGFMIWDGKSKGTLNNIINLTAQNKQVVIYLIPTQETHCIEKLESTQKLAELMGPETLSLFNELSHSGQYIEQLSLIS